MGMKTTNVTSRVLALGNNNFRGAEITLAAGKTLAAGTVLKRGTGANEFAVAAQTDEYAAVNPFDLTNESSAEKVMGFRVLMDGRVREDMLRVNDTAVTPADIDKLRNVGILPVKVTDLSHLDNQ